MAGPASFEPPVMTPRRIVGFVAMCVGMFMAILDIQIVSASLAEIQAGLAASSDEISWVQTSYLIAEVVMIPLSGFLSRALSTRWLFVASAAGFTLMSFMCATATSIHEMIVYRALQGFLGGGMIPTVFAAAYSVFPREKQPVIAPLIGLVATLAPTIGPTIGGYLTEQYGWPYVFFVNIIPGAVMLSLLYPTLEKSAMRLELLREGDWWGIGFMIVGLACLQTVLDEGNKDDWFGSPLIVRLSIIAAVCLIIFLVIQLRIEKPTIQLRLLKRRNFALGIIANTVVGFALFGSVYVLPTYLDEVQGYNSEQIGTVLAWVGLPQLVIIPFVPFLMKRIEPRLLVITGLAIFATSCFMNTHLSFNDGGDQLMVTNIVRALGQAVVLSPLAAITMAGMPPELSGQASGLFNMMRSLGGAIGTAILATIITKREQFHSNIIGQSVTPYGETVRNFLTEQQHYFMQRGMADAGAAYHQAEILLGNLVAQQSLIMGFSDTFAVLGGVLLVAAVAVAFTRRI